MKNGSWNTGALFMLSRIKLAAEHVVGDQSVRRVRPGIRSQKLAASSFELASHHLRRWLVALELQADVVVGGVRHLVSHDLKKATLLSGVEGLVPRPRRELCTA